MYTHMHWSTILQIINIFLETKSVRICDNRNIEIFIKFRIRGGVI